MRFAGDHLTPTPVEQKPVLPSFNAEDLETTPEMKPGPYVPGQDLMRDKYIRQNPGSGVASIDGQEVAGFPAALAIPTLIKGASKAYGAYTTGKLLLDGGAVNPGTRADYNNQDPTTKYNRHKQDVLQQDKYRGPATRSPYHQ